MTTMISEGNPDCRLFFNQRPFELKRCSDKLFSPYAAMIPYDSTDDPQAHPRTLLCLLFGGEVGFKDMKTSFVHPQSLIMKVTLIIR